MPNQVNRVDVDNFGMEKATPEPASMGAYTLVAPAE